MRITTTIDEQKVTMVMKEFTITMSIEYLTSLKRAAYYLTGDVGFVIGSDDVAIGFYIKESIE